MPALLVIVDQAYAYGDGNDDGSHHQDHYPRPESQDLIHLVLEPVDQLRVGGVALMEQDRTQYLQCIRHRSPILPGVPTADIEPNTAFRGW